MSTVPATLSIVCAVHNMQDNLDNLKNWSEKIKNEMYFEIIIVEDNSTDLTIFELKEFYKEFKNCRILQSTFGNPGETRNIGIRESTGDWLIFWDSDDIAHTDKIKSMIEFAKNRESKICFGLFESFNEINEVTNNYPNWTNNKDKNFGYVALNPGIWRTIFDKSLLKETIFKPFLMAEDQIFMMEMIAKTRDISFYNEIVYTYTFGTQHHLTKNPIALLDLQKAGEYGVKFVGENRLDYNEFTIELIAFRILLSNVKYNLNHWRFNSILLIYKFAKIKKMKMFKIIFFLISEKI